VSLRKSMMGRTEFKTLGEAEDWEYMDRKLSYWLLPVYWQPSAAAFTASTGSVANRRALAFFCALCGLLRSLRPSFA